MEKTRPILYGVADYSQLRKANAWFIGRSAKIRDFEAYYDVHYADRFDDAIAGNDIALETQLLRCPDNHPRGAIIKSFLHVLHVFR